MNTVVIPCFRRSEYLKICLEQIEKADGFQKYSYVFACDIGTDKETFDVIDNWKAVDQKSKVIPKPHQYHSGKQSFNVMNGLLSCHPLNSELIFYIEDDVFIGKDFFTFGEDVFKKSDPYILIMSKNVNGNEKPEPDLNAFYLKRSNEYQGIGSVFSRKFLTILAKDFNVEYFRDQVKYISSHYPDSKLNKNFAEQDGLIRRIIEKGNLSVAFSNVPRCFHAGFYGYHRNQNNINMRRLNFKERYDLVKKVAFDVNELKKIVMSENLVNDSLPVNLETSHSDCYEKK